MTELVLDDSIVLSWCLADEDDALANRAMTLTIDHGAVVPGIWWYECGIPTPAIRVPLECRQAAGPQVFTEDAPNPAEAVVNALTGDRTSSQRPR